MDIMPLDSSEDLDSFYDASFFTQNKNSPPRGPLFHEIILSTFSIPSPDPFDKIQPLSGSAKVSVEKDDEGNTTASAEISVQSEDGTYEASAEVSVNQDGSVSGKASAGINWKD